jgi:hypothetical protein
MSSTSLAIFKLIALRAALSLYICAVIVASFSINVFLIPAKLSSDFFSISYKAQFVSFISDWIVYRSSTKELVLSVKSSLTLLITDMKTSQLSVIAFQSVSKLTSTSSEN